jgi:hypothetical protein
MVGSRVIIAVRAEIKVVEISVEIGMRDSMRWIVFVWKGWGGCIEDVIWGFVKL